MKVFALTIWLLILALPAWAERGTPEEVPSEARPETESSSPASSSTLQDLVDNLSRQVGRLIHDLPRPRMDFALVVNSTLPAGNTDAGPLDQQIGTLLLGSISNREPLRSVRGLSGREWSNPNRARESASRNGFELLGYLDVSLSRQFLIVEGTLFETERHLWRDTVSPERQILGRLYVRSRVNAELRRHLPPLPTGPLSSTSHPLGSARYLGLAVSDLDGDDRNEIILLSRRLLEIRRLSRGSARIVTKLRLFGIPRSATRSRDPVGAIVVGPPDEEGFRPFAFRTSDHSQGMIARFDGSEITLGATLSDYPIQWDLELECSTVAPGRSEFQTATTPCGSFEETQMVPPYFAMARERLPQRSGPPASASAVALTTGTISLAWNEESLTSVFTYGTALAISDLNDDGEAEVLLSSNREPGTGDELTLLRFSHEGIRGSPDRLTGIPGSIWIAAAGDVDDDGLREFIAISQTGSGAQLLVVQ